MDKEYEVQTLYSRLTANNKGMVNASVGGSIKSKSCEEAQALFQRIADNGCSWCSGTWEL